MAFGVGMHFCHNFQGGFIATAKTLHPEVWAQLNDNSGDTTGGGTTTGSGTTTGVEGGDKPTDPSYNIKKMMKMKDFDSDEEQTSDGYGTLILLNVPYQIYLANTLYTITTRKSSCAFTGDPTDECDMQKEETRIVSVIAGSKTAAPPAP